MPSPRFPRASACSQQQPCPTAVDGMNRSACSCSGSAGGNPPTTAGQLASYELLPTIVAVDPAPKLDDRKLAVLRTSLLARIQTVKSKVLVFVELINEGVDTVLIEVKREQHLLVWSCIPAASTKNMHQAAPPSSSLRHRSCRCDQRRAGQRSILPPRISQAIRSQLRGRPALSRLQLYIQALFNKQQAPTALLKRKLPRNQVNSERRVGSVMPIKTLADCSKATHSPLHAGKVNSRCICCLPHYGTVRYRSSSFSRTRKFCGAVNASAGWGRKIPTDEQVSQTGCRRHATLVSGLIGIAVANVKASDKQLR